mgnify:CR=1 FL=1
MSDCKLFNLGCKAGLGFTKFVEPIPNKSDSISQAFDDSLFRQVLPANKPSPGKYTFLGSPYALQELYNKKFALSLLCQLHIIS